MGSEAMTGLRKSAMLMIVLGDDQSGEIFKYLDEKEMQQVVQEIASVKTVTSPEAELVLTEFHNMLLARDYVIQGGTEYARKVLEKAFGYESGRKVFNRILRVLESSSGFSSLQKADPRNLSRVIQNEHPQTIALILAHLPPNAAVELLTSLPEKARAEVVVRMATLEDISQEVLHRISMVLDQKMRTLGSDSRETIGGARAVAEIFNRMDRNEAKVILEKIREEDADLAMTIRNNMVVFEDLMMVDDNSIKELMQRADRKLISLALKGTTIELRQRFFNNMSTKAAELLKEEMEFMGQVRVRDVSNAQKEVMEIARVLEDEGLLSFGGGVQDEYVS